MFEKGAIYDTNNPAGDAPNHVADEYRYQNTPIKVPLQVEKHLEFIDISEDGYLLLGSSNLNSRYCTGSIWYFNEAEGAPDKEKCLTGVDCSTSVSDGKFLDKQKIIIGDDSGAVTLYTLTELEEDHSFHLIAETTRIDHDDSVLSLAVSTDKTKAATTGIDMCIRTWNTEFLEGELTYKFAHSNVATGITFRPNDPNYLFSSCSLDGTALLWDSRQPKPATALRDTPKEGLNALAWSNSDNNILAVGSVFGTISMLDIRTSSPIVTSRPYSRPIHKLVFIDSRWLAVAADTTGVKVLDVEQTLDQVYADDRHDDFVRGLAWHPKLGKLFSCGWDKQVISHNISPKSTAQ